MSMHIGPMPASPDNMVFRHQEARARAVEISSQIPENRDFQENRVRDIRAATQDLEQVSLAFNRRLKFEVDHESRDVIVKVIDIETDKVIREIPPEELQRLHQRIRDTIGFLFDQMV